VENGLGPKQRASERLTGTLQELMAHYGVPGVSVAVTAEFRISWAKGYGFANVETQARVTPDTIFQAGSISKAITAAGALRAVEEGRISLDKSINQFLRSWQLPENEYTMATPVTLRHLLGHTAGTTVEGYFGYFAEEPLPTLLEVLEGQAPAKTPPVRVDLPPGTTWRYSGGGYCVVQQALIDVYGRPFPEIMEAKVLAPVGMASSFFTERLEGPREGAAAWAHRANGSVLKSKWLGYPEMAAGGLWLRPSDLARFVIALQRALQGDGRGGISVNAATQMVSTTVSGEHGLGLELTQGNYFRHGGANPGYTSLLIGHRKAECGAAIMTNSEHGASLIPEILAAIAAEYEWPEYFTEGLGG